MACLLSLSAHNANDVVADRTVWIPQGKKYYMMPVRISHLSFVTVRVDGELLASDIIDEWAKIVPGEDPFLSMFNLSRCEHILFTGHGRIDGQGHKWWVKTILREIPDARPHLIYITAVSLHTLHTRLTTPLVFRHGTWFLIFFRCLQSDRPARISCFFTKCGKSV
jgi:hypothetical protein